jgi:phosphatidylglycerophosphate synthase
MTYVVTAIRLLLVVPFAMCMARGDARSAVFALIMWTVAVITDYLDGLIARRTGITSAWVCTFDHTTDFLFVTGGLFGGVYSGAFPWLLPMLIVMAFSQYTIDSYWIHRERNLRGSKLGRYNGLAYYAPPCMECFIRFGWHWMQPLLSILVWALVLSTATSMTERFILGWRARSKAFNP